MGLRTLLVAVACLFATSAQAGLMKCKAADGSVVYTDTSCPAGTQKLEADGSVAAAPAANEPTLSPRAMVFKQQMDKCLKSDQDSGCEGLEVSARICKDQANWKTTMCVAFREAAEATRAEMLAAEKLLANSQGSCSDLVYAEGSDEQVRACAARQKQATSAQWVQLGEFKGANYTSSTFMCMKKMERENAIGIKRSFRPQVTVVSKVPRGAVRAEHRVNTLTEETFATAGEAAAAGCVAHTTPPPTPVPTPAPTPAKKKKKPGV